MDDAQMVALEEMLQEQADIFAHDKVVQRPFIEVQLLVDILRELRTISALLKGQQTPH